MGGHLGDREGVGLLGVVVVEGAEHHQGAGEGEGHLVEGAELESAIAILLFCLKVKSISYTIFCIL